MTDSILDSVKETLGLASDYTDFDQEIMLHMNSVFSTLNQLGVGPVQGFMITDKTPVWSDYIGDDLRMNSVKSYMFLRVKMLFDPPQVSFVIDAMKEQIKEIEWRLNVAREATEWVNPNPPVDTDADSPVILDGGTP